MPFAATVHAFLPMAPDRESSETALLAPTMDADRHAAMCVRHVEAASPIAANRAAVIAAVILVPILAAMAAMGGPGIADH